MRLTATTFSKPSTPGALGVEDLGHAAHRDALEQAVGPVVDVGARLGAGRGGRSRRRRRPRVVEGLLGHGGQVEPPRRRRRAERRP